MAGNSWREVDYFNDDLDQKAITKGFKFNNFDEALKFTNKVGLLAEAKEHHPDMKLGWGYVEIWLTSHDSHGVTDKDWDLAKEIDQIN